MRRTTAAFFAILLVVSLIIFQIPAVADEATLPKPLTPRLSADGNTLYDGGSVLAVVDDPNPSTLRRIPAPAGVSDQPRAATASFSITYIPNGSTDRWGEPCYTFPEGAKTAFNAAANIWANILSSNVPITINACWASLASPWILGYSGGGCCRANFTGATQSNTWYKYSLTNALNGSDLNPSSFDMDITYNSNFNWYYGTDGNTPVAQHDFESVVLHEIGHGLNFSGSMSYSGGSGSWGYGTAYPNIYDVFMQGGSGTQLIDTSSYPKGSTALGSALTSNDIWFHGSQAMAANGNQRVKMYAPSTWSSGSSYSHLDYVTFNDTSNQLMVYAISAGESIHDPGAVTKGLLEDLGWPSSSSCPSCPGGAVVLDGDTFPAGETCTCTGTTISLLNVTVPNTATANFTATTSITVGSGTTFENGSNSTLTSPNTTFQPGSHIESGAVLNANQ